MGNLCYMNHSGKYIEINYNMKILFPLRTQQFVSGCWFLEEWVFSLNLGELQGVLRQQHSSGAHPQSGGGGGGVLGHTVSTPLVSLIARILLLFCSTKCLSVASVEGDRAICSSIVKFCSSRASG